MSLSYELLLIFKEIFPKGRFTHSKEYNKNLLSFMLVNKNWCNSFLPLLWLAPFFDPSGNRISTINTYLSCLSSEQNQFLDNHGITLPPTLYDKPMYNYPIYLKELQIHTLAKNVIKWCIEYDELYCHDIILRCLLELFSCKGTKIDYFEFGCMEYYSFTYDYWTKYPDIFCNINTFNFNILNEDSIKDIFKDVRHVLLSKDALYLYNFSKTLSKIFNKLEYLTADFEGTLWHEPSFDHIQCAIDLGILISCQKNLRNFELIKYKGSCNSCWLDSLKTQKISLSRIYFNEIEFLYQNNDDKLNRLKEFISSLDVEKLLNNKGFNISNFQTKTSLLDATFPKFKHVGFRCGYLEWRKWVKSQHQRQIDKRSRRFVS
ncbi:12148_t:CDS:1 [Funneliformis geosporum]|nr:12148_t:CDS:1 [Funneliformis geosporum]